MNKDAYFMGFAELAATASKCLSRKVGAVLVRDSHLISTGYNGAPCGVAHCEYRDDKGEYTTSVQRHICPRTRMGFKSGEGIEFCPGVHGEINAILQAAKYGYATEGTTLYVTCGVCPQCAKEIINAGIKEVVTPTLDDYPAPISTKKMFAMGGVVYRGIH